MIEMTRKQTWEVRAWLTLYVTAILGFCVLVALA